MIEYRPEVYPRQHDDAGERELAIIASFLVIGLIDAARMLVLVWLGSSWSGGALYLVWCWLTGVPAAMSLRVWVRHKPASWPLFFATTCGQLGIIASAHLALADSSPMLALVIPAWLAGRVWQSNMSHLKVAEADHGAK